MSSATPTSNTSMSYEEMQRKLAQVQEELVKTKRRVTGFVDADTATLTISTPVLKNAILKKVNGIYDSISVEQINYLFAGETTKIPTRKITLKRTWSKLDVLAPILPFFSILRSSDSIYSTTIDEDVIGKYVLDADVPQDRLLLDDVFQATQKDFHKKFGKRSDIDQVMQNIANSTFKAAIESKITSGADRITSNETDNISFIEEQEDFKSFLELYKKQYNLSGLNPKRHLIAAYRQSKTIVIHVPNSCDQNASVELITSGIVTAISIRAGKFFRHLIRSNDYQHLE